MIVGEQITDNHDLEFLYRTVSGADDNSLAADVVHHPSELRAFLGEPVGIGVHMGLEERHYAVEVLHLGREVL